MTFGIAGLTSALAVIALARVSASAQTPTGERIVWLDRLDVACVSAEWGAPRRNRSIDGNPLRIAGKTFRRGIGTHAYSKMVVDLAGGATRFLATVGLDDEMKGTVGTIEFTVTGDGRTLWTSGIMRPGDAAKPIDLDLTGLKTLILAVTDAGDGIGSDHADWANARFLVTGRDPVAVAWEADFAAESFVLLRRLQHGEPVLERKPAFARIRAIEGLYGRFSSSDTRIRPVLESLSATAGIPPSGIPWNRPLDRLALTWGHWIEMRKPPARMKKLPAADLFPGPVRPDIPRVAETVAVDLKVPFWHSTGLYAPPGEPVTVEIPPRFVRAGLHLQIGCHTDTLWHLDELLRAPEIANAFPLDSPKTLVANPFGGLIYVVVPAARSSRDGIVPEQFGWEITPLVRVPTPFNVRITGAVHAPRYVHGLTPVDQWREGFRYIPVPMAELVGKRIVFQIPQSRAVRIDHPDQVMEFWDEVMGHQADLAGWTDQPAPMYFTLDRQISAGGGHSGYPIMAYPDWAEEILELPLTRTRGGWGTYHELGHNHQWSEGWYFQDQVEVTVNLFSLYCNMKMSGWKIGLNRYPPTDDWLRVTSKAFHLKTLRRVYSRDPAVPGKWAKAELDERLCFHVELIDAFGWDALKKVILSYHTDPKFPSDESGRGGEFMVRWSKAAGRNLYPFFRGWGIRMPEGIEAAVRDLPVWMPAVMKEV